LNDVIEWARYETVRGTRFEARHQDIDLVVCWGEWSWDWSADAADGTRSDSTAHTVRAAKEAAEDAAYKARPDDNP
jgi:hypothetical protein